MVTYCLLYTQVDVAKSAFQSEDAVEEEDEDKEASPKAVGHNIFILAKQVCNIYMMDNESLLNFMY